MRWRVSEANRSRYNSSLDRVKHVQKHLVVIGEPFFRQPLPPRHRRRDISHPGEEFNKVVSRNGIVAAYINKLICFDNSGIAEGGDCRVIIYNGEHRGCRRSPFIV